MPIKPQIYFADGLFKYADNDLENVAASKIAPGIITNRLWINTLGWARW